MSSSPDFYSNYDQDLLETWSEHDWYSEETVWDVWENCILLSLESIFPVVRNILVINILFGLAISTRILPVSLLHILSSCGGIYLIYTLSNNQGKYLLGIYFIITYLILSINNFVGKMYCFRMTNFIKIFFIGCLTLCQHYLIEAEVWLEIRGIVMISAMKLFSLIDEIDESKKMISLFEYFGYALCGANVLFGPWIPYDVYEKLLLEPKKKNVFWMVSILKTLMLSLIFLTISNCWSEYLIPRHYSRWLQAYKEALSFRTSHYFISYLAECGMISAGFDDRTKNLKSWTFTIVKPLDIEFPSSLSVVVTSWNCPMHTFLKKYVFRPLRQHGTFVSIFGTFVASSFLHGFELKVSVILISLGLFSYIQIVTRNVVAKYTNICVGVKTCKECKHKYKRDTFLARMILFGYSLGTIAHLAYLGTLMDPTDGRGIIEKWKNLYFLSHIIMVFNFLLTF